MSEQEEALNDKIDAARNVLMATAQNIAFLSDDTTAGNALLRAAAKFWADRADVDKVDKMAVDMRQTFDHWLTEYARMRVER